MHLSPFCQICYILSAPFAKIERLCKIRKSYEIMCLSNFFPLFLQLICVPHTMEHTKTIIENKLYNKSDITIMAKKKSDRKKQELWRRGWHIKYHQQQTGRLHIGRNLGSSINILNHCDVLFSQNLWFRPKYPRTFAPWGMAQREAGF